MKLQWLITSVLYLHAFNRKCSAGKIFLLYVSIIFLKLIAVD